MREQRSSGCLSLSLVNTRRFIEERVFTPSIKESPHSHVENSNIDRCRGLRNIHCSRRLSNFLISNNNCFSLTLNWRFNEITWASSEFLPPNFRLSAVLVVVDVKWWWHGMVCAITEMLAMGCSRRKYCSVHLYVAHLVDSRIFDNYSSFRQDLISKKWYPRSWSPDQSRPASTSYGYISCWSCQTRWKVHGVRSRNRSPHEDIDAHYGVMVLRMVQGSQRESSLYSMYLIRERKREITVVLTNLSAWMLRNGMNSVCRKIFGHKCIGREFNVEGMPHGRGQCADHTLSQDLPWWFHHLLPYVS